MNKVDALLQIVQSMAERQGLYLYISEEEKTAHFEEDGFSAALPVKLKGQLILRDDRGYQVDRADYTE